MPRRLRSALLLTATTVALALPAAASAEGPARASDFTQPLPTAERVGSPTELQRRLNRVRDGFGVEGRVLYRTDPVEAPRRFDLVGVAGEMRALEFRARTAGGRWSDWVEAENGDPVYTGGSDEVQVRSRGVPIEGELHYVRLGDPPRAKPEPDSLRSSDRRRGPPMPKFISRSAWGANAKRGGCEPRDKPTVGRVKAGAIHHTVSTNDYSEAEAPGIVLGICQYHRNGNGWDDIGYNALVDRFGNIYEGRSGGMTRAIVGAQAEGHNSQTTGVATIGDHSKVKASAAERRGVINYLAWKLALHRLTAVGKTTLTSAGGESTIAGKGERVRVNQVLSHSDLNVTQCAGAFLRKQIPGIRRAVQERIAEYAGASPEPVEPGGGGAAPRGG